MRGKNHGYADEEEMNGGQGRQRPGDRCLPCLVCSIHLVKGPMTPSEVQDLMLAFNNALVGRAMATEMNMHLDHLPGQPKPSDQTNERSLVRINLSRDRKSSFEPVLISKRERLLLASTNALSRRTPAV